MKIAKKNNTKKLFFFKVFLLLILGYMVFSNNKDRPKILIVHSYDPGVEWVKAFDKGIKAGFLSNSHLMVSTHYMDTLSSNKIAFRVQAGKQVDRAIKRTLPEVAIFVGDEAQEFAGKNYLQQHDVKIIFAGIKNKLESYGYEPGKNISGVMNSQGLDTLSNILDNVQVHHKNIKRISRLADFSPISQAMQQQMIDYKWKNVKLVDVIVVDNFSEWKKALKRLEEISDAIVLTDTRSLKENNATKSEEFVDGLKVLEWSVKNSKVPLITPDGKLVKYGADFGFSSAGYAEGIQIANMALELINDRKRKKSFKHKIQNIDVFSFYINEKTSQKNDVTFPTIYKSLAIAIDGYF